MFVVLGFCFSFEYAYSYQNICKWLAGHFSTGICKNAKYSVQIIEKWQGNGRTSSGAINLSEAVLRRKRETELMLKLRTVYPH